MNNIPTAPDPNTICVHPVPPRHNCHPGKLVGYQTPRGGGIPLGHKECTTSYQPYPNFASIPPQVYGQYRDPKTGLIVYAHPAGKNRMPIDPMFAMPQVCPSPGIRGYIPANGVPGNGPQIIGCYGGNNTSSEGMDCPNYIFNFPRAS